MRDTQIVGVGKSAEIKDDLVSIKYIYLYHHLKFIVDNTAMPNSFVDHLLKRNKKRVGKKIKRITKRENVIMRRHFKLNN